MGLWRWGISFYRSSMKGIWREDSLAGDAEEYVEKAVELVISFHMGPLWGAWKWAHLLGTL
jgi:hypothetical protein